MKKQIKITVEYSADGLGWDEATREQALEYRDMLTDAIEAEYPECEVEVEMTINNKVEVSPRGLDDISAVDNIKVDVQEMVHDVWEKWLEKYE